MAGGVFHGILYHLVSSCQEDFCPVLGIRRCEISFLRTAFCKRRFKTRSFKTEGCGTRHHVRKTFSFQSEYSSRLVTPREGYGQS